MGVRLGARKGILESIGEGAKEVTLGTRGARPEPCEDAIKSKMVFSEYQPHHPNERHKWKTPGGLSYRTDCYGRKIGLEYPMRRF